MNYISSCNHPESYLTGSTVEAMVDKTKELGLKYFAIADHAYLSSALKGYIYGKKKGVKAILGVELFFKDNDCPFIKNTPAEQIKYYKIVVHAKTQEAYQQLVKLVSNQKKKVEVGGSYYPIHNWTDIEELCKYPITITTANSEDIVVKNLIINQPEIALKYYERLRGLVGQDSFYPSIIPYKQNQYWNEMVEAVVDKDGTEVTVQIPARDRVEITELETKNGVEKRKSYPLSTAIDLIRRKNKNKIIEYVYINKIRHKVCKKLVSAKLMNSFQDIPTGDVQLRANKFILALANKFGDKVLINNYSYYADSEDSVVQDMKLGEDRRVAQKQFMRSLEDSRDYLVNELGLSEDIDIPILVQNSHDWAENFAEFELKYDYRLPEVDGVPEEIMIEIIKDRGRMKWDDERYTKQFREEYELLVNNGVLNLVPYFLPIVKVNKFYQDNGYLVGPGRGSSSGFLLSYLMGVTQIDPIKYGLYSSRFLTLDRIQQDNLPDVDCDMESRVPLVGKDGSSGYLYGKYGNRVAQMSTRTLLRIKSAILDANRFANNGVVEPEIAALSKSLPTTPQGVDDKEFVFGYEDTDGNHVEGLLEQDVKLQKYAIDRPEEWDLVKRSLSLSRQYSRHACSYAIADRPIEEIVPIFSIGGVDRVTQPEAKQCEFSGIIKYDFLVVSALKDLRLCMDYINEKNNKKETTGYFKHNDELTYVWDLPEDQDVFKMLANGETESVFQLNTVSATPFVKKIKPKSILDISTITALVRPGPLGFKDPKTGRNMVEEYVERRFGRSVGDIPILEEMLPETYAVITYQEQINKLAKNLAGMNVVDSENVRIAVGKKKKKLIEELKPKFIAGASKKVDVETATIIWDRIETFARYGFNLSHSVAYSTISYACSFFKYHYPLEWWAAVLSNAKNKEINEVFYKYVKDMVLPPDINLSNERMSIDYGIKKIRNKLSMITGVGNKLAEKIIDGRPYANIQDFCDKKPCGPSLSRKLIHIGVLDSLFKKDSHLFDKMKQYEEAMSNKEFADKLAGYDEKIANFAAKGDAVAVSRTEANKKKFEAKGHKEGIMDAQYSNIPPMKDFLIKKAVFPTINLDLHKITENHSKNQIMPANGFKTLIHPKWGKECRLLPGEFLQRIDNMDVHDRVEFACAGYIVDSSEFTYHKTKKALKIVIDSSGYLSEKVIWPDYETGVLEYPSWIRKGSVGIFFYSKKDGKPYTNISGYLLEEEAL